MRLESNTDSDRDGRPHHGRRNPRLMSAYIAQSRFHLLLHRYSRSPANSAGGTGAQSFPCRSSHQDTGARSHIAPTAPTEAHRRRRTRGAQ